MKTVDLGLDYLKIKKEIQKNAIPAQHPTTNPQNRSSVNKS